MIRGDHARQELRNAVKAFESVKTVDEKVAIIFKLVTVLLKIDLSTRSNTSLIMKGLKIEPVAPKGKNEKPVEKIGE